MDARNESLGAGVTVRAATGAADMDAARGFFTDYARLLESDEGMSPCIHGMADEIAGMPGIYVPPRGGLWLAQGPVGPVGCVALRPHPAPGAAEIKRLWVAPEGRGLGTGRALVLAVISAAKELGYDRVLLDTAPGMQAAHALYRDLGFTERPPYDGTPMPGLLYFEREV